MAFLNQESTEPKISVQLIFCLNSASRCPRLTTIDVIHMIQFGGKLSEKMARPLKTALFSTSKERYFSILDFMMMNKPSLLRTFLDSNKKYLQEIFEDNRRLCFGAPTHFILRPILVPKPIILWAAIGFKKPWALGTKMAQTTHKMKLNVLFTDNRLSTKAQGILRCSKPFVSCQFNLKQCPNTLF